MSFALSSIGRARQKKLFFPLVIFILLLFVPLSPPSGVQASESLTNSAASPNSVGSGASEGENIDSMDVHPGSGRWDLITDSGQSVEIINGQLNISDVGDGSTDVYSINRELRDLDGSTECRFKINVNDTGGGNERFILSLNDETPENVRLEVNRYDDDGFSTTLLDYKDSEGGTQRITLSGDERVFDNEWYIFRLEYDILKSETRLRLFFDNGSKVFDYEIFDLGDVSADRPGIFDGTTIDYKIFAATNKLNVYSEVLIDYIKAPFKEREWTETTSPSDGDWLSASWQGVHFQDDISAEDATYSLTVPFLDAFSGSLNSQLDPAGSMAIGDDIGMFVTISGVDADDGDLHTIVRISIGNQQEDANEDSPKWSVDDGDSVTLVSDQGSAGTPGNAKNPHVDFVFSLANDRSEVNIRGNGWLDHEDDTTKKEFVAVLATADFVDDPSQEFVVSINYHIGQFNVDAECTMFMTDATIIERDVWSDIGGFIDDVIGGAQDAVSGGVDFFAALFRWVVSAISAVLGVMSEVLLGGLEALGTLLDTVITTLGSVITELQGLADDVAAAIWTGIETTLDFLFDAIDGIWTALIAILDDIIAALLILAEDAADLIFAIIEFILVLLVDIVEALWAVLEATIFFVWDALNLPDMIEIFDLILVYIVELVQWLVVTIQDVIQLAADLSWVILVGWWIWALPIQWGRAEGNPLGGLGNFIEVFFYDLIPWSFLGIHVYVPQGIAATLWMIFLLPADFALFTALGI